MAKIPDGYAAVPGRSHDKALRLLDATAKVGVDPVLVRSLPFGDEYHVPQEVADYYSAHSEDVLSDEDVAAVKAPKPFVPVIPNLADETPDGAVGTLTSGGDGTAAGSERDVASESDDHSGITSPASVLASQVGGASEVAAQGGAPAQTPDGKPVAGVEGSEIPPAPTEEEPKVPTKSASKVDWVAYVAKRENPTATDEELLAAGEKIDSEFTKEQLAEKYGA